MDSTDDAQSQSKYIDDDQDEKIVQRKRVVKNILIGLCVVVFFVLFLVVVISPTAPTTATTSTLSLTTPIAPIPPVSYVPSLDMVDRGMQETIIINSHKAHHLLDEAAYRISATEGAITLLQERIQYFKDDIRYVTQTALFSPSIITTNVNIVATLEAKLNFITSNVINLFNLIKQSTNSVVDIYMNLDTYSDRTILTNKYTLSNSTLDLLNTQMVLIPQYITNLTALYTEILTTSIFK